MARINLAVTTLMAFLVSGSSYTYAFLIHYRTAVTRLSLQRSSSSSRSRRNRPSLIHLAAASASNEGSSRSSSNNNKPSFSRLEGNARAPTDDELKIMDEMIDKLADAKPYELPNAVRRAVRVISSPQFFMRIANRADQATAQADKEKYSALASNLVSTLEAVISTTEDTLDERAKQVEQVVKAAAEPDSGEFLVPLLPERVQAMRDTMFKLDESCLDEGFLSTLDAWMNKSHQDGMDLMVGILQKALQLYAGIQIQRARQRQEEESSDDKEAAKLLDKLLQADADTWDMIIEQQQQQQQAATPAQLLAEVQRTTESIILQLDAGSMAQRVQAEYLQELMKRIESIQQKQQTS